VLECGAGAGDKGAELQEIELLVDHNVSEALIDEGLKIASLELDFAANLGRFIGDKCGHKAVLFDHLIPGWRPYPIDPWRVTVDHFLVVKELVNEGSLNRGHLGVEWCLKQEFALLLAQLCVDARGKLDCACSGVVHEALPLQGERQADGQQDGRPSLLLPCSWDGQCSKGCEKYGEKKSMSVGPPKALERRMETVNEGVEPSLWSEAEPPT